MSEKPDTINVPVWISNGMMMTRRECLDWNDPEHPYNYVKREYNVDPEDYGMKHPLYSEFEGKSRSELIDEIVELRQDVLNYAQFCG